MVFDIKDSLKEEILLGLIVAVILAFMMQAEFYSWIVEELISYGASVFFIMPIALGIIQRKLPKEYIVLTIIGGVILAIYAFVFNYSAMDIAIIILQTIIVVTVISIFYSIVKRLLERQMPPPWKKPWWKYWGE